MDDDLCLPFTHEDEGIFVPPVTRSTYPDEATRLRLDMWQPLTAKGLRKRLAENKLFKSARLHLLRKVTEFLTGIEVDFFACSGTALAMYREGGKMIAHDHDIDLGMLESQFGLVHRHLDHFGDDILVSATCSTCRVWFRPDGSEIPYDGCGQKRFKFYLSREGLAALGQPKLLTLPFDLSRVHIDLFTFGQHPDDPESFCFNWNMPGEYDYREKKFPKDVIFPLCASQFEGLSLPRPNRLKDHLEIEYGYLGRDARYNSQTHLYEKIPSDALEILDAKLKSYVDAKRIEDEKKESEEEEEEENTQDHI